MATRKKISMSPTPAPKQPDPDDWVRTRTQPEAPQPAQPEPAPTAPGQTKRLTVDLPADLHRALKIHAASQGVQMVELVRQWIRAGVEDPGL